ncbi:uncharacterized protein LOC134676389 [Cydia fagiglandana]|uniref:uncharacterized protein LOC134676389 n=1 Tax=Cydia fagiglandana TaxID=1458189 RepID=UPI002FEE216A
MSLHAARVKEESDTMADDVFIKQEESELDCVELPYVQQLNCVTIEAAIVDVEFDPPVPPEQAVEEEPYSEDLSDPAVYMSRPDELLKPECLDMPLCSDASVSQYADVKDELLLEPACINLPASQLTSLSRDKFNPVLTDCCVRIERCVAAEKALKQQMAELYQIYVKENRMQTRTRDDEDFLCGKCKQNEKFEFCEVCNMNMRALNQLRNLRGNRHTDKTTYTCEICREQFQEIKDLYQHKFVVHGIYKILQMKNPTEFYSAYLSRVYSNETMSGSTSNLLNTTNVNTDEKFPIEYKKTYAREVMPFKIGTDLVKPENMIPKAVSDYERTRKPYSCKVCNKPAKNEKLCVQCLKERLIRNLFVKKARVKNKFLGNKTVLKIKRPQHLRKEKLQTGLRKQPKFRKIETRECFVRLERCEAAEQALWPKIDAVRSLKSEIVAENTVMWSPQSNLTSDKSEERCCNMCRTKTPPGVRFCAPCEKIQAENFLIALKNGLYSKRARNRLP